MLFNLPKRSFRIGMLKTYRLTISVYILPVALALSGLNSMVNAGGLTSSLDHAMSYDPVLQAAVYAHQINLSRIPQARAALLPAINFTTQNNLGRGSYVFSGSEVSDRFVRSNSQTLQATQVLYRPALQLALEQSKLQAMQTLALLHQAEHDLLQRLLQAYIDLQIARNQQEVALAQVKTQALQLAVAQRGLVIGMKTLPEVYEAQSKLGIAQAQVIEAAAQWRVKRWELLRITGETGQENAIELPFFADSFLVQEWAEKFSTNLAVRWAEQARLDAPAVRVQMVVVDIALREIEKNRAAHLPAVDLTVSRARNSSSGNASAAQNYDSSNRANQFGIQVTVPLFAGGGIVAKVRESVGVWEKAQFDLETAQLLAESNAVFALESISSATAQIQALQASVEAAQFAIETNTAGMRLGSRTPLDVLNAEQQFTIARRDWRKARFDLIMQVVKLRASAGMLDRLDLRALDEGFQPTLLLPSDSDNLRGQRLAITKK